ncbi:hypothetical protein H0A36_25815 [Endozoicomonas sp. SM1973]|uniref:Uncharacterized protein n=1 Tax=Spartinivicinus marinus TaxID=2994442 RepID=A0A853IJ58_9GAMM|nr:hypothetical protein [Spartinivicinus marinus]MCX4030283.1 hypothetical protein [Spartinivicinus marinus]MCX4030414.1 hypothetical protein [Spartinivicinus marinus]NYZ69437.1 hypothetical protein [Spartinivicinus marinus]
MNELLNTTNIILTSSAAVAGAILGNTGFWKFILKKKEENLTHAKEKEALLNASKSLVDMQASVIDSVREHFDITVTNIKNDYEEKLTAENQKFEQALSTMRLKLDNLDRANRALHEEVKQLKLRNEELEQANKQLTQILQSFEHLKGEV